MGVKVAIDHNSSEKKRQTIRGKKNNDHLHIHVNNEPLASGRVDLGIMLQKKSQPRISWGGLEGRQGRRK